MPSKEDLLLNEMKTILAQCVVAANEAAAAADAVGRAGFAPLESPQFTGEPTATTPSAGDASARIMTTAFLANLLGRTNGVATLDGAGVVPLTQLPFAGLVPDGSWDADTNTPTLVSGSGVGGHFRVVSVAGTTTLDGESTWNVGDWALFAVDTWTRIPYTPPPLSNVPLSSLEGIASNTLVGNTAGGSASPTAIPITSITALLSIALGDTGSGGSIGLVPAPPPGSAGSGAFLAADMTYQVPPNPDLSSYAPLNSPAFTGTATVVTQSRGLSSTAIASTEFVIKQLGGTAETGLLKFNGTAACGTSTYAAPIDHIHPSDPAIVPYGTVAFTIRSAAPAGWLLFADQTMGGASSGATYANADAVNVFTELYNNVSDANCPLLTSNGSATTRAAQGSAAAAFNGNCRMTMPKALGRALAVAGSGANLTARALGQTLGEEEHTMTTDELVPHGHTMGIGGTSTPFLAPGSNFSTDTDQGYTGLAGGGEPFNIMQPTLFLNAMIKL